ncbi:AbrB/MazE/SpoVT family DNA-binding domain-containing protein [Dubosiella newyorkensis]|uniref:AbrB/MazE/SpoVT family DNA-binding domain-containing protein n=1 Tax=Dubosiella newyorkensis TaxID=1862672 RepID=UPI00272A3250|nr:AbrB/MazE/SpoVT family DNA-binding domain-containing protein [Dubosiella newyorkensis]
MTTLKGVKLSQWGNSQGIRLPKSIIELLKLNTGDDLGLEVKNNQLIVTPLRKRKTVAERFAEYRGPIELDEVFSDDNLRDGEYI